MFYGMTTFPRRPLSSGPKSGCPIRVWLYCNHYLESNWNSIRNTGKGLKSILTIKNIFADIPKSLTVDVTTVANLIAISNIFNNHFSSIADKMKLNIAFPHKHFSNFLKNRCNISFFESLTHKTELGNIISSD